MGMFKLGKMTFGSLFKKPETVLYPVQVKERPAGLKGHIAIDVDACILCGMCERSCPTDCITVDKPDRAWKINRYSCIQCGYCATVCPKACLHMDPSYAPAAVEVVTDVFDVPNDKAAAKGAEGVKQKSAAPAKAAEAAAAPAQPKPETPASAQETAPAKPDAVLEAKIALLDEEKAAKVRAALAAR